MPPSGRPTDAPATAGGDVRAGRVLTGRYRLERRIASGGMAQVWEASDEVLRRKVAVKVLHPHLAADESFLTRFRQEAVAAARLTHPGIVAIFDTCSDADTEAIVMELVPGRTLRDRLDEDRPIDPWQAAALAAQVAEALEAAHQAGLVHRDVKPANVLLSSEGRVKVADFGIAKAMAEADLTQPGLMVGTAKYLAPEQVRGEGVDPRTDVYSLGVVLYEMLCGRPPFSADTDAATALARLTSEPLRPRQVRPSVPKALEEVVCRAMARQPEERYPSASAMRAALLAAGAAPAADSDLEATTFAAVPDATAATSGPARREERHQPSFTQTERAWLIPTVVVVLVAVSLGVAGLLIDRSGAGDLLGDVRNAIGGQPQPGPVAVTSARAFDPPCDASLCQPGQRGGDGHENDEDAPLAVDGDAATAWRSEGYDDRDITLLKPGVGLVLQLEAARELTTLEVDSPNEGWRAVVYVAGSPAEELAGWGKPVATTENLPAGTARIDLGATTGQSVLLWIVDRGEADGRAPAEITEVRVSGR